MCGMRASASPLVPHPAEVGPRPRPQQLCSSLRAAGSLRLSLGVVRAHTATARVSGLRENSRVFSLEVGKPVLRERTEEGFVQWGRWERQSREA